MNKKQLVMEAANTVIDYLYYGTDKEFCSEIAEHIQDGIAFSDDEIREAE